MNRLLEKAGVKLQKWTQNIQKYLFSIKLSYSCEVNTSLFLSDDSNISSFVLFFLYCFVTLTVTQQQNKPSAIFLRIIWSAHLCSTTKIKNLFYFVFPLFNILNFTFMKNQSNVKNLLLDMIWMVSFSVLEN